MSGAMLFLMIRRKDVSVHLRHGLHDEQHQYKTADEPTRDFGEGEHGSILGNFGSGFKTSLIDISIIVEVS